MAKLRFDYNNGTRYYVERDQENATRQHVLAGFRDQKGRAIGFQVIVGPCKVRPYVGGDYISSILRFAAADLPETIYWAKVQATRDGSPFGASQDHHYFRTQDEAFEHAAEKVARGTKRYAKQFKKG